MILNILDQIGNWNPQLFREIKGRLKIGNIAIASILSICAQLLLFWTCRTEIPIAPPAGEYNNPTYNKFCFSLDANNPICLRDAAGNFQINWQYWYLELFVYLSIFSAIALLVAGTYLLVSDLDQEERRGTLNFIRLSPQSAKTIFLGKILGVPILLYLAAILTVPLHLYSGLTAQIPLHQILCFYGAIAASCALFYSAAMLFGLTTSWLGGFQPWLAGAAVLIFTTTAFNLPSPRNAADLITFLSPAAVLKYSVNGVIEFGNSNLHWLIKNCENVKWFNLPIGNSFALSTILSLSICGVLTYWMWQGWQRRFPNPSSTVLSKRQSYLLVFSCQPIILGFALQSPGGTDNITFVFLLNLVVFVGLIAALTPERQALYDWARYRQQIVPSSHKLWRRYPMLDLIWSEKSPAIIAIALNLLISTLILTPLLLGENNGLFGIIVWLNLIAIYATVAQLFLFAKIRNQAVWAVCTVGGAIVLPPIILSMLSLTPEKNPLIWMSTVPFVGLGLENTSGHIFLLSAIGQWTVLVLLNLQLSRQLKIAGESASKALLRAR
ncbi:hypothetical protein IQ270_05375 [Microcoleus sp. LEGE 07076]|uniref:hypothetical protein n=1 Tax=Microcoleus sp. LEGE 07076 TaxID=915322 RepID=UPI00188178C6|nr:hypothetical protein [Microcoleus sp. LEGE 07076]MBE9184165.1 hypothetical protein [Microcoleus sp. LEGE 07076]